MLQFINSSGMISLFTKSTTSGYINTYRVCGHGKSKPSATEEQAGLEDQV